MTTQQLVLIWSIVLLQGMVLLVVLRRIRALPMLMNGLPPGMRLPNIAVVDVEGSAIPLRQVIRRATILCVVTPGCPFCKRLTPELEKLGATDPELSVILLAAGEPGAAAAFREESGTSLPIYMISYQQNQDDLRTSAMPFGFLVNRHSIIVRRQALSRETVLAWLVDIPLRLRSADPEFL